MTSSIATENTPNNSSCFIKIRIQRISFLCRNWFGCNDWKFAAQYLCFILVELFDWCNGTRQKQASTHKMCKMQSKNTRERECVCEGRQHGNYDVDSIESAQHIQQPNLFGRHNCWNVKMSGPQHNQCFALYSTIIIHRSVSHNWNQKFKCTNRKWTRFIWNVSAVNGEKEKPNTPKQKSNSRKLHFSMNWKLYMPKGASNHYIIMLNTNFIEKPHAPSIAFYFSRSFVRTTNTHSHSHHPHTYVLKKKKKKKPRTWWNTKLKYQDTEIN